MKYITLAIVMLAVYILCYAVFSDRKYNNNPARPTSKILVESSFAYYVFYPIGRIESVIRTKKDDSWEYVIKDALIQNTL
jgi:hypothetical protein